MDANGKKEKDAARVNKREMYIEMVKNDPSTRVTRVDAVDTHALLEMAQIANRVMKKCRDQGGRRIPIEVFGKVVNDYDDMILHVSSCLQQMCKQIGMEFFKPRSIKEIEKARGKEA
jgi:hypothetical protein